MKVEYVKEIRGDIMRKNLRTLRREMGIKTKKNKKSIAYSPAGQQLYPSSLNALFKEADTVLRHPKYKDISIFIKHKEIIVVDMLRAIKLVIYGTTDYRYVIVDGDFCLLHRMIAEANTQRLLRRYESVHHIDGDKFNNLPSNLQIMTIKQHKALHAKERQLRKGRGYGAKSQPICK